MILSYETNGEGKANKVLTPPKILRNAFAVVFSYFGCVPSGILVFADNCKEDMYG